MARFREFETYYQIGDDRGTDKVKGPHRMLINTDLIIYIEPYIPQYCRICLIEGRMISYLLKETYEELKDILTGAVEK
tara:strand:+ start:529 stop:762 length:234 start_codon:yes stop_codon:yes gene_type:complete